MISTKPLPHPKIWRLPVRKRMTIAIGTLSDRWIVMGADREESGYFKRTQEKIVTGRVDKKDGGVIAVTGAGTAGYLDAVTNELIECYFCQWRKSSTALERAIGKRVYDFISKHVLPFAAFPPDERPEIDLLIGTQERGQARLLITNKTTMIPVPVFDAVGCGAELAKSLMQRLYPPFPTADIAEALITYVIFYVKESIVGCGKSTGIVRIENNRYNRGSTKRTAALESLFRSYLEFESVGLHYLFGVPEATFIKNVINSYNSLRAEAQDIFKKFPTEETEPIASLTRRLGA